MQIHGIFIEHQSYCKCITFWKHVIGFMCKKLWITCISRENRVILLLADRNRIVCKTSKKFSNVIYTLFLLEAQNWVQNCMCEFEFGSKKLQLVDRFYYQHLRGCSYCLYTYTYISCHKATKVAPNRLKFKAEMSSESKKHCRVHSMNLQCYPQSPFDSSTIVLPSITFWFLTIALQADLNSRMLHNQTWNAIRIKETLPGTLN